MSSFLKSLMWGIVATLTDLLNWIVRTFLVCFCSKGSDFLLVVADSSSGCSRETDDDSSAELFRAIVDMFQMSVSSTKLYVD